MSAWIAALLERYFNIPPEKTVLNVRRAGVAGAAALFVLMATLLVAFDDIIGQSSVASLQVGDIARQDIHAPYSITYVSEELTEQRRQEAMAGIPPIFDPADRNVGSRQSQLARQILDFINNVRHDPFATVDQKLSDLSMITALTLDEPLMLHILEVDDTAWQAIDEQVVTVLERVMRNEIRETDVNTVLSQLPLEVSVRSSNDDAAAIVAIVADLIRPNTFENPTATQDARAVAAQNVQPVERSFERGQIIVREGTRIEPVDYEALTQLGLLKPADRRLQAVGRALIATIVTMVTLGLYIARFRPELFRGSPRFLLLMAVLFLLMLTGARFLGVYGQIYAYPTAALGLMFVSLVSADFAAMGTLSLAILVGLMAGNSLEITVLVTAGGLIGTLTLKRTDNFNSYFFAGLMIVITNVAVVALFNLDTSLSGDIPALLLYSVINGILAAAAALVGMYIVTQLFNLPTSLKLLELSRPNQPLLQRLLREAPGTYQHSLQVANLGEQAANTIGANAELVHVAALYHDIGKMLNAQFFVENQATGVNPHNALNDPYRSADIIIGHVTEGDKLAKQYRLPTRLRDFILEHHGTTQVAYFYRKAVEQTGDESAVSIEEFTYPGPRPQSRDTALLMLADSCESTVRARQPSNKQEIADIVNEIIQSRIAEEQLDDSGLTLHDIKVVQKIFVDMLQAVFHPRINYPSSPSKTPRTTTTVALEAPQNKTETAPEIEKKPLETEVHPAISQEIEVPKGQQQASEFSSVSLDDDSDAPLPNVPPLRRTGENRIPGNGRLDILGDLLPEEKDEGEKP